MLFFERSLMGLDDELIMTFQQSVRVISTYLMGKLETQMDESIIQYELTYNRVQKRVKRYILKVSHCVA